MSAVAHAHLLPESEGPLCLCGAPMRLSLVEPHPTSDQADIRTFKCDCGHTRVQTFTQDD
jgi:hypothetical protein